MNIWMRFEDTYGCYELFKYSNSYIKEADKLQIDKGLGVDSIFSIGRKQALKYDYIICIFDLDEQYKYSLDGLGLIEKLKTHILKEDHTFKSEYTNKIIPIPIFSAFETLYLYTDTFKDLIEDIENIDDLEQISKINSIDRQKENIKLINLYRTYYDYSERNAEDLFNIANNLDKIRKDMHCIQNNNAGKGKFYLNIIIENIVNNY